MKNDWNSECIKYHGRVLKGKKRHYCYDWDGMPIDETCKEFDVCCCVFPKEKRINYLYWLLLLAIIVLVSLIIAEINKNL